MMLRARESASQRASCTYLNPSYRPLPHELEFQYSSLDLLDALERILLLLRLEATVAKLGRGVDELEVDVLKCGAGYAKSTLSGLLNNTREPAQLTSMGQQ